MLNKKIRFFSRLTALLLTATLLLFSVCSAQAEDSAAQVSAQEHAADQESLQAGADRGFSLPSAVVGLWVLPERDLFCKKTNTKASFQEEVRSLLTRAKAMHVNTFYLETGADDGTLLSDAGLTKSALLSGMETGFDPIADFITQAKKAGITVFCTLDLLCLSLQEGKDAGFDFLNTAAVNFASKRASDFAKAYAPDGVLLSNYYNPVTAASFSAYYSSGSGLGYPKELYLQTAGLLDSVSYVLKEENSTLCIGLLCDAVWANRSSDKAGSATQSAFQMQTDAHLDLPALLDAKTVDLVLVDVPYAISDPLVPFPEVISWWAALAAKTDTLLTYRLHNEYVCTDRTGYTAPDQLLRQMLITENAGDGSGCCLYSLPALENNPMGSTDALLAHFSDLLSLDDA